MKSHAKWVKDGIAYQLLSDDDDYWVESLEYEGWMHYRDLTEQEADELIEAVEDSKRQ